MIYFVVTELSFPRLVLRTLLDKPTVVLATYSILRGRFATHLERLVDRLGRFRPVRRIETDMPEVATFKEYSDFMQLADPFAQAEPWIEAYFGFADSESRFGEYAIPYRHACCNTVFWRLQLAHLVHRIHLSRDGRPFEVLGLDATDREIVGALFGPEVREHVRVSRRWSRLWNAALPWLAMTRSLAWILPRVTFRRPEVRAFRIGFDHIGQRMDSILVAELGLTADEVALVYRETSMKRSEALGRTYTREDGRIFIADALGHVWRTLRDHWILYRKARRLPPDMLKELIVQPYHRSCFRTLLNVVSFKVFVGHDDYNSQHALHTLELRKRGTLAVGMMHGLPAVVSVIHQDRHIDFDEYFVIGADVYERRHKETWPTHMKVVPVGSLGATREQIESYRRELPPNVFFVMSPCIQIAPMSEMMLELADAFPDRTIHLSIKREGYIYGEVKRQLDRLLAAGKPNIVLDTRMSYDVLRECRYILSDGSTLNAEGIQFGHVSLFLDVEEGVKFNVYRAVPGICVKTGEELVQRIKDIESGTTVYPREACGGLIRLDGRNAWDVLVEELTPHLGNSPIATAVAAAAE